jgi:hypothetical protein
MVTEPSQRNWTKEEDARLREHYPVAEWPVLLELMAPRNKRGVLARAKRIGLSRTRMDGWTAQEDDFLISHYGLWSPARIGKKLGRSEGAVNSRKTRLGLYAKDQYLSFNEVAHILGFKSHNVVTKWAREGKLKETEYKGKAKTGKNTTRRVLVENLEKFIQEHPDCYDWRRINGELYPDWQRMGKAAWTIRARPLISTGKRNLIRKWTAREDKFLIDNYATMTLENIAIRLQRSVPALYGRAIVLRKDGQRIPDQTNTHVSKLKRMQEKKAG